MTQTSGSKQQSAFSHWLRTGRLPADHMPDGVDTKFNPWHDPADGQFTFVGAGRYYGAGGNGPAHRTPASADGGKPSKPRILIRPRVAMQRLDQPVTSGAKPDSRRPAAAGAKPVASPSQPNAAAELIGGVGEGLYGVTEEIVATARSVLTTSPITTVRNVGRGIASAIDSAIAAEDTPARVQMSRAAEAVANASPREIGRAAGSVVGNAAVTAVPGAALRKVIAARRFGRASPPINYDPPHIGWVKENLGPEKPSTRYNDAATGARPGQAPTLMRTMPDGSKRPVKFDSIPNEYPIDRK